MKPLRNFLKALARHTYNTRHASRVGLLCSTLALAPAYAQNGLGMEVVGDEDSEFGLMIAKWLDEESAGPMAPGLTDTTIEAMDVRALKVERATRLALEPLARQ